MVKSTITELGRAIALGLSRQPESSCDGRKEELEDQRILMLS